MSKRELLLYTPLAHKASYRLEKAVATVVPKQATEAVHTRDGLTRRLRKPNNGLEVVAILAASRKELRELLSLSQILEGLRIILVLPDADPQTIAQGHSLQPRFVTNIHSDFQDVAAVLGKIRECSPSSMQPYNSPNEVKKEKGRPQGTVDSLDRPLSR